MAPSTIAGTEVPAELDQRQQRYREGAATACNETAVGSDEPGVQE